MTNPIEEAVALLPDMVQQRDAAMKEENAVRDVNHGIVVLWGHEADTIIAALEAMRDYIENQNAREVIGTDIEIVRTILHASQRAMTPPDSGWGDMSYKNGSYDELPTFKAALKAFKAMQLQGNNAMFNADQKARDDAIWNEAVKAASNVCDKERPDWETRSGNPCERLSQAILSLTKPSEFVGLDAKALLEHIRKREVFWKDKFDAERHQRPDDYPEAVDTVLSELMMLGSAIRAMLKAKEKP